MYMTHILNKIPSDIHPLVYRYINPISIARNRSQQNSDWCYSCGEFIPKDQPCVKEITDKVSYKFLSCFNQKK